MVGVFEGRLSRPRATASNFTAKCRKIIFYVYRMSLSFLFVLMTLISHVDYISKRKFSMIEN